jgi:hypothetical protein
MSQQMIRPRGTPTVELKAVTWNKDSHGLFDYENNQYEMKKFQISHAVKIYRINNDIIPTTKEEVPFHENHKTEFLLSITQDLLAKEKYFINLDPAFGVFPPENSNFNSQMNNIYLIVRSLKANDGKNQRGYALTPGDMIKFGRIQYKVIECTEGEGSNVIVKKVPETNKDESFFDLSTQVVPEGDLLCKYCLSEDCRPEKAHVDNQLMFPCKCLGPSNGVHFLCLKTWIQHKIVSKSNNNTAT